MNPRYFALPLTVLLSTSAMAGQFIWTGAEDSAWTKTANWDTTTAPPTTAGAGLTYPAYGTDYTADNMRIANGAGAGAVFDPASDVTTTFRSSRGIIIGVGAAADLTVSSGTIAVINGGGAGQEPIMANGVSANLLINGGAIDTTGSSHRFHLVHNGAAGLASTMTITSGSFSATTIDLFVGTASGTSTINLEGGFIAVNRFWKTQAATTSTLNLNGGTLRARNNNTNYLNALDGLSVLANDGGGRIDTNGFNITITANIASHPDLDGVPDGGLVKMGAGNLTLNGNNTFTGGVRITEGFLNFDNGALGTTGPITMDGGTLHWRQGFANEDVSSRLVMVDGTSAILSTGDETTAVSFGGAIGNDSTASLVKQGAGILTLTQANTYTGNTTVGAGTLRVNGSLSASSNVTVEGGVIAGSGTINGSVALGAGGSIAPGGFAAGTLNIGGDLDVSAAATGSGTLRFRLNALAATSDRTDAGGTLAIGDGGLGFGNFQFTDLGGLEEGTYILITSGAISGTLDGDNLSGQIGGFNGTLAIDGSVLVLEVSPDAGGFAAWQAANSTAGGLDDDHDNDGVSNGIEYFLGGVTNTTGFTPLPAVTNTGGTLSVTWTMAADYAGVYGTDFAVETSATLAAPWTNAILGSGQGFVEITGSEVKYTFPAGIGDFVRLKVTGP